MNNSYAADPFPPTEARQLHTTRRFSLTKKEAVVTTERHQRVKPFRLSSLNAVPVEIIESIVENRRKREYYKNIFRKCVQDVISLEAAGKIFSAISEKKKDRSEYTQEEVENIVHLNLLLSGKVKVKESTLLFKLLRHFSWHNNTFTSGINVPEFRNSLATLYMALKPISTSDDKKSENLALSYCPTLLLKHLIRQLGHTRDLRQAKYDFIGVCLFADISGFTKLSRYF
jgi:hypothetical protein